MEWNLHSENAADKVEIAFEALLARIQQTKPLTPDWIDALRRSAQICAATRVAQRVVADETHRCHLNHITFKMLPSALRKTRAEGHVAGLVVLATGLGKTWLAAFDSRSYSPCPLRRAP